MMSTKVSSFFINLAGLLRKNGNKKRVYYGNLGTK
jgi:hypothetical protein